MKTLLIFSLLLILLSTCKKDDEFNAEVIPGEYEGHLAYFDSPGGDVMGSNITRLSSRDGYKTSIKKVGPNYVLSFDKSFIYEVPDITVEIYSTYGSESVYIRTLKGQAFSSIPESNNNELPKGVDPYPPKNYFRITKHPQVVTCFLTLMSNNPDSTYFLNLNVFQLY